MRGDTKALKRIAKADKSKDAILKFLTKPKTAKRLELKRIDSNACACLDKTPYEFAREIERYIRRLRRARDKATKKFLFFVGDLGATEDDGPVAIVAGVRSGSIDPHLLNRICTSTGASSKIEVHRRPPHGERRLLLPLFRSDAALDVLEGDNAEHVICVELVARCEYPVFLMTTDVTNARFVKPRHAGLDHRLLKSLEKTASNLLGATCR